MSIKTSLFLFISTCLLSSIHAQTDTTYYDALHEKIENRSIATYYTVVSKRKNTETHASFYVSGLPFLLIRVLDSFWQPEVSPPLRQIDLKDVIETNPTWTLMNNENLDWPVRAVMDYGWHSELASHEAVYGEFWHNGQSGGHGKFYDAELVKEIPQIATKMVRGERYCAQLKNNYGDLVWTFDFDKIDGDDVFPRASYDELEGYGGSSKGKPVSQSDIVFIVPEQIWNEHYAK